MFNLSTLLPGDAIATSDRGVRIVVKVVDLDGARGGLVDTRPTVGRYSRTSGFELGDEVLGRACDCGKRSCFGCDPDCECRS